MIRYLSILILYNTIVSGLSISGTVSDSTNKSPLIGANVIISETSLGAATDSDGRYNINQIAPGDYIISVSYMGYKSYKKNITINNNENVTLDISLAPEAIKMNLKETLKFR